MAPVSVVDVGIPTYGRPPYLAQAIQSVLGQTLTSWRLTISENGPGGGFIQDLVEPYLRDPRVRYAPTGENLGARRNHAVVFRAGSTPFVALLHDDDLWEPEFLARRVDFLEANSECGFVFGANVEIDGEGRELARCKPPLREGVVPSAEFVGRQAAANQPAPSSTLVRRSAFEAVGARFDERFLCYDWDMWLRLGIRSPVGFLAGFDSAYRIHPAQTSANLHEYGIEMVRFYSHIDALVARELPEALPRWRHRSRRRSAAFLTAALDAIEGERRRDALRFLTRAVAAYPPSAVDPRVPTLAASLPLGSHAPRAVAGLRRLVHRRRLRVHLLPPW